MSSSQTQALSQSEPAVHKRPTVMRKDIQALRALAVGLVVIYHLWPKRLTGGFIGVDVFFVISGFLITSHLIAKPPKSLKDFGEFWGRRIRRLLPIAFLVMALTAIGVYFLAPVSQWAASGRQLIASAFYVQNWSLAGEAVDYLAADNVPTALQHYWSLSVEEQFYIFWPLFLGILAFFAARQRFLSAKLFSGIGVSLLITASLAWSYYLTQTSPGEAYFVTTTRMWELAFGGFGAFIFAWVTRILGNRNQLKSVLSWAGILMIMYAAITYDATTAFPGVSAMIPVLGTVLVLVVNAESTVASPTWFASNTPTQHLGDISYGIYLWHWPIIVLLPGLIGETLKWPHKLVVLIVIIALASASKYLIEDPFRKRNAFGKKLSGSYIFAISGMCILAIGAVFLMQQADRAEARSTELAQEAEKAAGDCFGGNALVTEGCVPHGESLLTQPNFIAQDKPAPYTDGCWVDGDLSDQKTCIYGADPKTADAHVALVGNSHGGHWLPALEVIAKKNNWSIETFLASECFTVLEKIQFESEESAQNCLKWNERVVNTIADGNYDSVVISNRTYRVLPGMDRTQTRAATVPLYEEVLGIWEEAGVPVLVIRDTPYADVKNVPVCVDENRDDLSACDGDRSREVPDPLAEASMNVASNRIATLDLTDRICRDDICYSVVGGVIVYFDAGHLSATFARSLADPIGSKLEDLVERKQSF
ncbi:acyltransferase family protein [Jonesiaceae bacterium BS-20]|uniref:Acyltransferase family protein n=1 Tax=Jonesiaceae bacterium BS-20 TaxID=3120821 RepID=A0AAU7DXG2_9MICO